LSLSLRKRTLSLDTNLEWVDLEVLLSELLMLCRKDFKKRGIRLGLESSGGGVEVYGVRDQLMQVFLNLLTNAREAIGDKGGMVQVEVEKSAGGAWVRVKDDGCGIQPEDLDRIFEPFFSSKPAVKGTGLGLAVSYGIVQRHGGRIEVESTPGKGSIFSVFLPRKGASDA